MKNSTLVLVYCIVMASMLANKAQATQGVTNTGFNTQAFAAFYTEDFAGGLPSGWTTVDSAGNGINWRYTTTGPYYSGYDSLSVTMTSAANGYMIYESDSLNSVGGENAYLQSAAINCSAHSTVHLVYKDFLQHYAESATVQVSNDGSLWTEVFNASTGILQDQSTANPRYNDIDISAVAANEATVYIRFSFVGDFDYFWMIDDIELTEIAANDAGISSVTSPSTSCSLLSNSETVTVNIYNNGGDSISNFPITYIVDNGTPVTETVTTSIAPGANFLYDFTAPADLSAAGVHTVTAYVVLTGDTNNINDSTTSTLYNGPRQINGSVEYENGFESNDDVSGYTIEDANNDSVSWELSPIAPHSGTMCAQIAAVNSDDWLFTTCLDFVANQNYYFSYYYRTTTTATQARFSAYLATGQTSNEITDPIVNEFTVTSVAYLPGNATFTVGTSGTYYIGFHVADTDSLVGFRLDDINISSDSITSVSTPVSFEVLISPNPTSGNLMLNIPRSASLYNYEIVSPLGQVVREQKNVTLSDYQLDLNDQPSGLYIVRIFNEKESYTRSISLSH